MIELSITVQDSETKLIDRETCYDPITLSKDDPKLKSLVESAMGKFLAGKQVHAPEEIDVWIKTKMLW